MLEPNDRLLLLEVLRPPPGFTVDAAVGTTYTLHLDALLIPPAAWAVHSIGDRIESTDPVLLVNSLRSFADRTLVFHQAGAATPFTPANEELGTFLDEMVFPVRVGPGATFHPKIWVIRFSNSSGEQGWRLLIGSRNLSLEPTWDVLVSLDSGQDEPGSAEGAPIAELLRSLPNRTTVSIGARRLALLHDLAADLDELAFVPPAGCSSAELMWWTRFRPPTDLFPEECGGRLVISPFLGSAALKALPAPTGPARSLLVSRASSLTLDAVDGFEPHILKTDLAGLDRGTEDRLGADLHAKVFAFDHGDTATLIIGSANATSAAFANNDEVVVRLTGPVDELGVQALLGTGADEIRSISDLELVDLLEPYTPDPTASEEADDDVRWYEPAISTVASIAITGSCVELAPDRWQETLQLVEPIDELGSVSVQFTLLGHSAPFAKSFVSGSPVTVETSLEGLTRFVVARFADRSGVRDSVSIVLIADIGMPAGRSRRALRRILTNRERFARFLRYLLEGVVESWNWSGEEDERARSRRRGRRSRSSAVDDLPILERMLRLLVTSPEELRRLDQVIAEFSDDPELLPDGFADLWHALQPLIPEERA